jgi:hypothetical protein
MLLTASDYWYQTVHRIRQAAGLKAGWDGYGAPAPPTKAIYIALYLSQMLINSNWIPPTSAIPTAEGRICLTWVNPLAHLEFSCHEAGVDFEVTDRRAGTTHTGIVEGFTS